MLDNLPEAIEIEKKDFNAQAEVLREKLLDAQFALADAKRPLYILITGLDGSGRGAFINRLNEWMDPRGIETHGYWQSSDEEESRPYFWRYWRNMPRRGEAGIFVDAWYSAPLMDALDGVDKPGDFELSCEHIRDFEEMLVNDGAVIVKLFLHVSRDVQKTQLAQEAPRNLQNPRVDASPGEWKGKYKRAIKLAEKLLFATDIPASPWHAVRSDHPYQRDLEAGNYLLQSMEAALVNEANGATKNGAGLADSPAILAGVDMKHSLDKEDYREKLDKYQSKLQELVWKAHRESRSMIAVFEGWDAAGKGSAILRVTQAMDPQLFRLVQYAAPSDEELARHYLWRFWRHLGRDGRCTLFDRSWYGRVLVERVEGFAREDEWRRAYEEIRRFEWQLHHHGSVVLKFWLHITPEEQLRRFKEREQVPRKQHKITDEDWRNRDKWPDYEQAVNEMIYRTDTDYAPWHVIPGNDKRYARIDILKALCKALESALD